jgi:two-component system response regulator YesN
MALKTRTNQKRMLMVDDHRLFMIALEGILLAGGNNWQTVKAIDAVTALTEIENQTFDLIVTDFAMPGMNGLDFVEIVRQSMPDTPIILLSGHDLSKYRNEVEHLNIFRVLRKPVPVDIFLNTIREATESGEDLQKRKSQDKILSNTLDLKKG